MLIYTVVVLPKTLKLPICRNHQGLHQQAAASAAVVAVPFACLVGFACAANVPRTARCPRHLHLAAAAFAAVGAGLSASGLELVREPAAAFAVVGGASV